MIRVNHSLFLSLKAFLFTSCLSSRSSSLSFTSPSKSLYKLCSKRISRLLSTRVFTACNRLVINKPISGAFAWLATACWRQVCCKLSTDLLQVDCQNLLSTGLLQVVSASCNKSANDKLQKPDFNGLVAPWWNWQVCCNILVSLHGEYQSKYNSVKTPCKFISAKASIPLLRSSSLLITPFWFGERYSWGDRKIREGQSDEFNQ